MEFDTPEDWWKNMMGRKGFLVWRDGVEAVVVRDEVVERVLAKVWAEAVVVK